mgnify:FL=1
MKKKNSLKKKVLLLTFIFLFITISVLSPFMLVEGANKKIGYILLGIIIVVYLFILLVYFWDWFKEHFSDE